MVKRFPLFSTICFFCIFMMSCSKDIRETYTYWRVASNRYSFQFDDYNGEKPITLCFSNVLLIKNLGEKMNENPPWVIREEIKGFYPEEGYEYILHVRHSWRKKNGGMADDWSPHTTEIIDVLSKEHKTTDVDINDINYRELSQIGYSL